MVLETDSEGQRSVDLDVNTVQDVTVNWDGFVEVTQRLVVGETDRGFEITTHTSPSLSSSATSSGLSLASRSA